MTKNKKKKKGYQTAEELVGSDYGKEKLFEIYQIRFKVKIFSLLFTHRIIAS